MKTSNVKEIVETSGDGVKWNGTYFQNLVMVNGDKMNIGAKKPYSVNDQISYEIIGDKKDDGSYQHEFPKAKRVNQEYLNKQKEREAYTKGIEVGHAVNNAVNMLCAGVVFENVDPNLTTGNKIVEYARNILAISNKLKNE